LDLSYYCDYIVVEIDVFYFNFSMKLLIFDGHLEKFRRFLFSADRARPAENSLFLVACEPTAENRLFSVAELWSSKINIYFRLIFFGS
jgi:hypothetical protein